MDKHRPYLVRWVREFLHVARMHRGYTFEQTLDLFLAEVRGRVFPRGLRPPIDHNRSGSFSLALRRWE